MSTIFSTAKAHSELRVKVETRSLNGLVEQQAVCGGGVVHTVFKGNGIRLSHGHLFCDSGVCTAWSECRGDGTQSILPHKLADVQVAFADALLVQCGLQAHAAASVEHQRQHICWVNAAVRLTVYRGAGYPQQAQC